MNKKINFLQNFKFSGRINLILSLSIILISIFLGSKQVQAIDIYDVEISDMLNGRATIKWKTDTGTRGEVNYGLSADNLNRFMGYSLFDIFHESVLTGLEKDQTYYYKITAFEENNNNSSTFVQSFSTDDMIDTHKAKFEEIDILQIIDNAVAISWTTDEKTKAKVYYGTNEEDLNKNKYYSGYSTNHNEIITRLDSNQNYFLRIDAIDEDDNETWSRLLEFKTNIENDTVLEVSNIRPQSSDDSAVGPRSITISWKSNLVSKGMIYYGTKNNRVSKRVYGDGFGREHSVVVSDLSPDTVYYFKVKSYDSFYRKSETSDVFSIKTAILDTGLSTGNLVKSPNDNKVYIINENSKSWIESGEIFEKLGYQWQWIKTIDEDILNKYEDIKSVSSSKYHPNGTLIKYDDSPAVYMIYNRKKRPFFTGQAFKRRNLDWANVITLSADDWKYSTGDNLY